ncbi:hypothetical protein OG601_46145 [Streptomyces sp. NBC_01239]|uniref:hypothetical protein n=1 Tax=Streptomyces sp. NBC_01239 TaxID=2903792 RepID=UPI00225137FE|nr:hypothetical protein [Streptomyces sp. NBC_01239]MCX4817968.1 hypothetical protein [Streptomyces sp. NBC_01239]
MTLRLRGTFAPNPRVAPLLDGTVTPQGIEVGWTTGEPGDLHSMHLRDGAYDVFEFSISNYIVTTERTNPLWDWLMLPVFTTKATLGLNTVVNTSSGIASGADLRGTRFGIPDYTMTAALWFRAQLAELWDIASGQIEWFIGRQGEESHGRQMGFESRPPKGVSLIWAGAGDLNRMLQDGRLDASFPAGGSPIDTSTGAVAPLFPDRGRRFTADYHASAGFLPVNHAVLVRRSLVEAEPWCVEALLTAFEESKQESYRRDARNRGVFRADNHNSLDNVSNNDDIRWQNATFGDDPFAYGLAANRMMLATAARQSRLDGLTEEVWDFENFIPESLLAS